MKRTSEFFFGFSFFLPFLICFFLFIAYPVIHASMILLNPVIWDNLFRDPYFLRSISNTILYVGIGVNLKMILALFLSGLLTFKDKYKMIKIFSWTFILPWALPEIVTVMAMKWIFNTDWGTLNILLKTLGFPRLEFFTNYFGAMLTMIYAHIWRFTPFWTLMLYSLRITIPQELFESADVDGASLLYKFRFITWPLLKNSYLFFTVLSTIWVIGSFTTPWLMTGGAPGGTTFVAATIGYFYYFGVFDPAQGLAATMSFLPLILSLLVIVLKLRRKVFG